MSESHPRGEPQSPASISIPDQGPRTSNDVDFNLRANAPQAIEKIIKELTDQLSSLNHSVGALHDRVNASLVGCQHAQTRSEVSRMSVLLPQLMKELKRLQFTVDSLANLSHMVLRVHRNILKKLIEAAHLDIDYQAEIDATSSSSSHNDETPFLSDAQNSVRDTYDHPRSRSDVLKTVTRGAYPQLISCKDHNILPFQPNSCLSHLQTIRLRPRTIILHTPLIFVRPPIKHTDRFHIADQVDLDGAYRSDFSIFKYARVLAVSAFSSGRAEHDCTHLHGSRKINFGPFAGVLDIGHQAPVVNFKTHRLLQSKLFEPDLFKNAVAKISSNTNVSPDQHIDGLSHIFQSLVQLAPNVSVARYRLNANQPDESTSRLCLHSIFKSSDRLALEDFCLHNTCKTSADHACLHGSFKPSLTYTSDPGNQQDLITSSRPKSPSLNVTFVGLNPTPVVCDHNSISITLPDDDKDEPFEIDPDVWEFLQNEQQQYPQYWLSSSSKESTLVSLRETSTSVAQPHEGLSHPVPQCKVYVPSKRILWMNYPVKHRCKEGTVAAVPCPHECDTQTLQVHSVRQIQVILKHVELHYRTELCSVP
ncbi:uncharacterized protein MELLADRAFT_88678 [Melampsora larici-populina 98AG31]|uniref:Uncharacterized protein n=1 Tax=Melampsora larici-populina (strain 98AG31 / pathotype 3-4-7) TaxID=747676 RepID=F4RSK7_MELLP|nr:uncharacterized protein MELLADRAFT_88678 [Melampsora larici-populina 98AG31]EGG04676.1 hypothetical protein MELLADRAFT_88678 [Melampsora larici-populina 98AG31]